MTALILVTIALVGYVGIIANIVRDHMNFKKYMREHYNK